VSKQDATAKNLVRIFPLPSKDVALRGLYLSDALAPPATRATSFVYANFIASLDGRISLLDPRTWKRSVPDAIANRRDWRLFQELNACADALLTSGRHVRALSHVSARSFPISSEHEYEDLVRWRLALGLAPQPAVVVVTASLDFPPLTPLVESGRVVYVATGAAADPRKIAAVESQGVRVLIAGDGARVEGRKLVDALAREARSNIALIAGGEVLDALIVDNVLDRLYLTLACRLVGGLSFDTLLTGPPLAQAARFKLKALHYDAQSADESDVEQLFAIFDRGSAR
jgi:riboflavin biosynthesis pyrimidine reductase